MLKNTCNLLCLLLLAMVLKANCATPANGVAHLFVNIDKHEFFL
jgi:hypothetical protein